MDKSVTLAMASVCLIALLFAMPIAGAVVNPSSLSIEQFFYNELNTYSLSSNVTSVTIDLNSVAYSTDRIFFMQFCFYYQNDPPPPISDVTSHQPDLSGVYIRAENGNFMVHFSSRKSEIVYYDTINLTQMPNVITLSFDGERIFYKLNSELVSKAQINATKFFDALYTLGEFRYDGHMPNVPRNDTYGNIQLSYQYSQNVQNSPSPLATPRPTIVSPTTTPTTLPTSILTQSPSLIPTSSPTQPPPSNTPSSVMGDPPADYTLTIIMASMIAAAIAVGVVAYLYFTKRRG